MEENKKNWWSRLGGWEKLGIVVGGIAVVSVVVWLIVRQVKKDDSNKPKPQPSSSTARRQNVVPNAHQTAHQDSPADILKREAQRQAASDQSMPLTSRSSFEPPSYPHPSQASETLDQGTIPSSYLQSGYNLMNNLDTGVEDLDEALPALEVAVQCLKRLKKEHINEV